MKEKFTSLLNTIKDNFKKNKIVLLVVAILWTILIVVTLNSYSTTLGKQSIGNSYSDYVTELNTNTKIVQTSSTVDGTNAICLKMATYARSGNSGEINIKVVGNKTGTVYANESIKASSVNDNSFNAIGFDKDVDASKDDNLIITITSTSPEGKGAGIYYSAAVEQDDEEPLPTASISINDELQEDGALTYKYLINNEAYSAFYKTVITWVIVGLSLLILIILLVNPSYEILFPIIIFVFGLIFMAVIVPLSAPDEETHYEACLQLTNYLFSPNESHIMVNKAYVDYNHLVGHYNVSGGFYRMINDLNEPLKLSEKMIEMKTIDVADVYKVCYYPQTLGIIIARLLGLNFLRTYYAGKFINLIVYCVVVYFALKKTPVNKFLFGVIYSMPMLVQTATSYTYDNYINCLAILLIAYFLKFRYVDEKIKWYEYAVVLLCCAGLAPLKFVYGFLSLIFLFVPSTRYSSKRVKAIASIVLMVAGMYIVVPEIGNRVIKYADDFVSSLKGETDENDDYTKDFSNEDEDYEIEAQSNEESNVSAVETNDEETEQITETETVETEDTITETNNESDDTVELTDDASNSGTVDISSVKEEQEYKTFDSIYSVKFVFAHPWETIQIFYRTVRYSIKTWFYSAIGRNLSGSTLILPLSMVHLLVLIPLIAAFREEEYVPTWGLRTGLVGVCAIVGLVIMAGFFVTWTSTDQTIVEDYGGIMVQGIQGRYFSPLLTYFFAIFNNKKIKLSKKFDKYILIGMIAMIFVIVVYVMSYTFMN